MASKKILTVFGATGAQGGSVVQIFLNDAKLKNEWSVRGVTRDATKDSAKKLQSQGAEVVSADMNDKASLVKAMQGAAAVFAVTNYWEKMDKDLEIKQGKDLVDAAKETGVQQFIWSSLYDINKLTNGKLPNVYHFDSKAEVEVYARDSGIPATFFMPGFYMTNIPGSALRKAGPEKPWTLAFPFPDTTPIPLFYTADTGKFVKAAVLNRDKLLGKRLLAATAYYTAADILAEFKATFPEAAKDATYTEVPADAFKKGLLSLGMPDFAAEELYENFILMHQFGYYGGDKLDETHSLLDDKLTTWVDFIKESKVFKELK